MGRLPPELHGITDRPSGIDEFVEVGDGLNAVNIVERTLVEHFTRGANDWPGGLGLHLMQLAHLMELAHPDPDANTPCYLDAGRRCF